MITAVCSNLAIIMERTDEQILPAVYNFIGRTFDATPSQLGALTLSRAFAQAITSPLGGVLGERRQHLVTVASYISCRINQLASLALVRQLHAKLVNILLECVPHAH